MLLFFYIEKGEYKMILKIKKIYIYLFLLIIGILLLILSIHLYNKNYSNIYFEISFSFGCGLIQTAMVSYLIDKASEIREINRINQLRSSFLYSIPCDILTLVQVVIEKYYPSENIDNKSYIVCFNEAIKYMKTVKADNYDVMDYKNYRESLMKKFNDCFKRSNKSVENVSINSLHLILNSIFSEEEILAIKYLGEEFEKIKEQSCINEIAETLESVVECTYDKIKEIKASLDKKFIMNNRTIKRS